MQVQARARQRIAPSLNGRFPLSLSLTTHAALARKAARNAHADCIAELVRTRRVSLTLGNRHGRTALHWAAYSGCEPAIAALVAAGAPVNQGNSRGFTALHHASENAHLGCVRAPPPPPPPPPRRRARGGARSAEERSEAARARLSDAVPPRRGVARCARCSRRAPTRSRRRTPRTRPSGARPPRSRSRRATTASPSCSSRRWRPRSSGARASSASSPSCGRSRPPTRSSAGARRHRAVASAPLRARRRGPCPPRAQN